MPNRALASRNDTVAFSRPRPSSNLIKSLFWRVSSISRSKLSISARRNSRPSAVLRIRFSSSACDSSALSALARDDTVTVFIASHVLRRRPMAGAILATQQLVGLAVAGELFGMRIEAQHPAGAGGDVCQVAERGRQVAGGDVGIKLRLAAANAIQEVRVMGRQV